MNSKNLIILIISIIILALIGGGVVWYLKMQRQEVNPAVTEDVNQPEEIINQQSEIINTEDWLTYRNKEYGFELRYPINGKVGSYSPVERSNLISVYTAEELNFNLTVYNPNDEIVNRDLGTEKMKIRNMELDEYVDYIWNLNKEDDYPDKKVGEIQEIVFNNSKAYKIEIEGSYKNETGGHLLDKRYFLYFSKNDLKFIIELEDDALSETIISTFQFIN